MTDNALEGALKAANKGWAVHPCNGKKPTTLWADTATTDPHQVVDWLSASNLNYGVAAGPSGLLILDDDTGTALLDYATAVGETIPDTFTVDTARGCHYYFTQPETPIGCSTGALPPGIDVKGAGGYVIGPGSVHATGVIYTPRDPDKAPAPAPTWIVKALNAAPTSTPPETGTFASPHDKHVGPIPMGQRHRQLFTYACRLRAMGLRQDEAEKLVGFRLIDCEQPAGHGHHPDRFTQDDADALVADVFKRYAAPDFEPEQDETEQPSLTLVRADNVQPSETQWLEPNLLPAAHPVIFLGDEGIGKGLYWCDRVGRLTTGLNPIDVIIIVAEDDPEETVVPRLVAAGADRSRVHFLVRDTETLTGVPVIPGDNARVSALIEQTRARLVIIDPWMSVVPGHLQVRDTQQARQALDPVTRMARATGATFLLVTHTNRTSSEDARQRYGATIALRQAGRVCLMALADPDDDEVIYVGVEKSNIGVTPPAVRYRKSGMGSKWRITPDPDSVGLTIRELIAVLSRDGDGRTSDKWTAVVMRAAQNDGLIMRQEIIAIYADAPDPAAAADKAISRWRNMTPPRLAAAAKRGVFEVIATKPPALTPPNPHYIDTGGMGGNTPEPPEPPAKSNGGSRGVDAGGSLLGGVA